MNIQTNSSQPSNPQPSPLHLRKKKGFASKTSMGLFFLVLLILGLASVGLLMNLSTDLRQQASTAVYGECIYWSSGVCPGGFTSATCANQCAIGGVCCTPTIPTSTPVVTPMPTPSGDSSTCPNFDPATNECSGFIPKGG